VARAASTLKFQHFFAVGQIQILASRRRALTMPARDAGASSAGRGVAANIVATPERSGGALATRQKSQHGYSSAAPAKCLISTQDLAAIESNYHSQSK